MASITKHKAGYRVQISVRGIRESAVLATLAEAKAWASEREVIIRNSTSQGINTEKTVQDAFDRYKNEVSEHKKGKKWELIRLDYFATHEIQKKLFSQMRICNVTTDTMTHWRDTRLKSVKGSTVNRELNLLSHVFNTAQKEWKWISENPITNLRRPKDPEARDRLICKNEIERICFALGYDASEDGLVQTQSERVAVAFLFAIETGMRSGEILAMIWNHVHESYVHIPRSKNNTKRDVPLSNAASLLLKRLPENDGTCFNLTDSIRDALFRKARDAAMIVDLHFHDTRHEAVTRLANKLNILELARMIGHKDLKMLQRYYNETAEEIAKKL